MKTAKWIGLAALVGLAVTGALWGTGQLDAVASLNQADRAKPQGASPRKPPAVTVVAPKAQKFIETLRVNGSLVAREEVLVAPQIEGQRIAELLVEAGATVVKGQLLARLATENLDALVAQTDAALLRAEAGIARAGSSITRAEAQLTEATAALERARPLSRSGYLSDSTLDQRQSVATTARAALAIARHNLKVAESERAEALAKRRELVWRRSRTAVHAPVAGLVLTRSAKLGAIATATGDPMFRIARAGEIELDGEVTSDQIHRLAVGQAARISLPGRGTFKATVRLIDPRVDPETRLGHVRLFVGARAGLRVGTFTSGEIEVASSDGLAIPSSAVMRDAKGAYVRIVEGGKVQTRRIALGLASGGFVEVRRGLQAADRVIAKAGTFLGDGEPVTPVDLTNARPAPPEPGTQPKAG